MIGDVNSDGKDDLIQITKWGDAWVALSTGTTFEHPQRWGWLKKEFTQQWLALGRRDYVVSAGRQRQRRRGIWQPRYWEHTLEDEDDFERHFDYIHWNPVKHGYVQCPREWPHSSFHRYVRLGVYEPDWGCFTADKPPLDFGDMEDTAGEP